MTEPEVPLLPAVDPSSSASSKRWHHVPDQPVSTAPFLHWPLRPAPIARHLASAWWPLGTRVLMLVTAIVIWNWFSPTLAEAEAFRLGWMAEIWVRNVVLIAACAGLPHLWLYVWRRQDDDLRFDARPLGKNKRLFLFNDQVKDNVFLSLVPAPLIGTLWESLGWWAYANGHASMISFDDNPVWFIAFFALVPVWSIVYFSLGHWLLHRGPAYTHVHSWHHKNVNVGPWSGLAMHPGEHVVLYGDVLFFLVIASHPVHFLFAMMHHSMGAPLSHTGYDAMKVGPVTFPVGDFYHQLHHRFIECNYGGPEAPLDDWLGSLHDGTAAGDEKIAARRRQLSAARRGNQ